MMQAPAPVPLTGSPTILLVDDERDILDALASFLDVEVPGARVLTAISGDEALILLRRERIHLIVADQRMPDMTGIELVAKARIRFPQVPAILITAYPDPELAARAVNEAGIGFVISKPFDVRYLGRVIVSLVGAAYAGVA